MKRIIVAVLVVIAPFSQALSQEEVTLSSLIERDGIFYDNSGIEPFTGLVVEYYENGQPKSASDYEDGEKHGLGTTWYRDGSIHREVAYHYGERHGLWMSWSRDEELLFAYTYDDGKRGQ